MISDEAKALARTAPRITHTQILELLAILSPSLSDAATPATPTEETPQRKAG